ncbi:MAG: exosortase-associated EpsI family protein, partial [bacterium]|nr:exosortase-associated EpsI family protein [bacterium]
QLVSSQIGVGLIRLYGMTAFREGNVIDLGFTQLQVVEACNGLRYLLPLTVMSILIVYLFKERWWKGAIVILSSIPISIITNSLRIALTGMLYEAWGAKVAEGFFHGFSGWLIFMISLAILLIEMWVLRKIAPNIDGRVKREEGREKREDGRQKPETKDSQPETSNLKPQTIKGIWAFLSPPQFVVALILLGATLAFSHGIEFREKIPAKKSFDLFPLQIKEWSGTREAMEQKFIDELDLSDYVIVNYADKNGK